MLFPWFDDVPFVLEEFGSPSVPAIFSLFAKSDKFCPLPPEIEELEPPDEPLPNDPPPKAEPLLYSGAITSTLNEKDSETLFASSFIV